MVGIDANFKTKLVTVDIPEDANVVFGMSHFIKTVEDLYETLVSSSTSLKFGIAFCEASMKRLIRTDGNDPELIEMASSAAFGVACGHTFFIYLRDGFPINVLGSIKACPEVCTIYCATANPVEVIVLERGQGRAVVGVVDGEGPAGVETEEDQKVRKEFLRKIGYKR